MTNYLLAGGGTAGHVNPLITVGKALLERNPSDSVFALGTQEGLEAKLVPAAGLKLLLTARVPFPRRPNLAAVLFPFRFFRSVSQISRYLRSYKIDVLVGFGGYVSAPAYLAAKKCGVPIVIHEANALPGMANRWGNRFASAAGRAFKSANLANSDYVGMPIRPEIIAIAGERNQKGARRHFGLDSNSITLLVTGGSLGSRNINREIENSRSLFRAAGIQILHIVGDSSELEEESAKDFRRLRYCHEMELAIAAADFAVSRAGASTVSEFAAVGLPALYIPYPVGNGEQKFNVRDIVEAGGGISVEDSTFTEQFIRSTLIPTISDGRKLLAMSTAAKRVGILDGTARLISLIDEVTKRN